MAIVIQTINAVESHMDTSKNYVFRGGQTGHKGHHIELGNVDHVERLFHPLYSIIPLLNEKSSAVQYGVGT